MANPQPSVHPPPVMADVAAASVKLSPLSESFVDIWFARAEAMFFVKAGIKLQDTKFAHLISILSDDQMVKVHKAITEPRAGHEDPTKTSLGRPFRGPYQVLDRNAKYYRLDIDGKVDNVSIDRLKPATGPLMDDARVPSHITIRRRHVYPPLRLDY
ncbi:hypothetical protein TCAL_14803 [Tigriopus californicus]|uniref:Uncharacterized protein n=1 Tax=Tigriopus californicus TaxID=6832 RepID=A0A553PQW2_TIGCA|nr:hypothetical protein TCAL_14803 [Tigriopus californicus]